MCLRLGDPHAEAIARANLGWAYQRSGDPARAVAFHRDALSLFRDRGDRYNEAEQMWGLGSIHQALGAPGQAWVYWRESIALLREMGLLDDEAVERLLAQRVPATPEIILLNS
jgi:tetratricopeptide (TPR) repeat protein